MKGFDQKWSHFREENTYCWVLFHAFLFPRKKYSIWEKGLCLKWCIKYLKKDPELCFFRLIPLKVQWVGKPGKPGKSSLNHPARPCLRPGVPDLSLLHVLYPGAGHKGQDRNAPRVQFRLQEHYPLPKRRKNLVFSWHFLVLLPELWETGRCGNPERAGEATSPLHKGPKPQWVGISPGGAAVREIQIWLFSACSLEIQRG